MIPQIDNSLDTQIIEIASYPNKTYKCSKYQVAGKVDDIESIEQAVEHILSTERYAYLIYDDNYGVELEQYIGQSYDYLESTIQDTLKEALTQDDRIIDVQVTDIHRIIETIPMIDKTNFYKIIQTENDEDIVTEQDLDNLVTERELFNTSISKVEVAVVEFDVYCKQGIIHTEVSVNV